MPNEIFHLTSAGSVDDGKSTILARLLLDTESVFEDQLGGIDPSKVDATTIADLLDGLESEREQGITIDVAHRFFDSQARRYHLADSPGHEQYTRNMATAASHADGMLLVVDARVGVKPQTQTHFTIARMLGITQFVVAVNKMDLVGYNKKIFREREESLNELFHSHNLQHRVIPVSGLAGDNIVKPSKKMSWWTGPTVLEVLEGFTPPTTSWDDAVFHIQYVQRIPGGGRRYLGSLLAGSLSTGDTVSSQRYPGKSFEVVEIIQSGATAQQARGVAEISVRLDADIDLERGDVLSEAAVLSHTDQFEADLVWLDEAEGFPGRNYLLRLGHTTTKTTMTRIFRVEDDGEKGGGVSHVAANELVRANVETHEKISLSTFTDFQPTGRFVLVDPDTGNTVASGIVNHTLRRAENLTEHHFDVKPAERSKLTGQEGKVAWFTGLSGSGKSTLANAVSLELAARRVPHAILDGDTLRLGLNKDLGFSEADRVENIRRTAEVATMMADSGLIVLVSLISPYRTDREHAKDIIGAHRFREVFVDTPLEVCEQRDPKGLYQKARAGLLPNFTGIDSAYEPPEHPSFTTDYRENQSIVAPRIIETLTSAVSA